MFFRTNYNMWACIGETHIGKSHIESNLPCQDRIAYICNTHRTVCALCDGLGSRKNSHYGASLVSNTVVNYLSNHFKEIINKDENEIASVLLNEISKEVKKYSKEKSIEKSSLECTLLFASIADGKYLIGKIGDGVLGTFKEGKSVDNLFLSKGGNDIEYANATFTALDEDAFQHFTIKKGDAKDIDCLFMISDGLPFLSSKGKTAHKLFDFFRTMSESENNFSSMIINKEIAKKVSESELYVDDWSYIFVNKLSSKKIKQVKTYYNTHINDVDGSEL